MIRSRSTASWRRIIVSLMWVSMICTPIIASAQALNTKEIPVECDCLAEDTWEAVKWVVSERYPVAILDKTEGRIETEWYSHGGGGVYEYRFVIDVTDDLIVITAEGRYAEDKRRTPACDTAGLRELALAVDGRVN
ncbi:MAG: hypothetical protein JW885_14950 [Deltaproteobacteria bacterium]|nr:hypothetical protein [Candidatus Zymogenaceae bacterium]